MYGVKAKKFACFKLDTKWVHIVPMTKCVFQSPVRKNTHRHKEYDWLTSREYYGSTSTKQLRIIIIGFDNPTNNNGNKDNDILTITSLASDPPDAGKGGGRGLGNIAIRPGCLQSSCCHPCHQRWWQGCPLPPLPACCCPHPPHCQSPLPRLPGCCSPPRQTYLGPPHRPSLLQAYQQRKLQVRQRTGPSPLRSSLPPLQSLLSQPPRCAGDAIILMSLCRQVE